MLRAESRAHNCVMRALAQVDLVRVDRKGGGGRESVGLRQRLRGREVWVRESRGRSRRRRHRRCPSLLRAPPREPALVRGKCRIGAGAGLDEESESEGALGRAL